LRAILSGLVVATPPAADMPSTDGPEPHPAHREIAGLRAQIATLNAERDDWTIERSYGQQQLDALVVENGGLRAAAERIAEAAADMARIKPALTIIGIPADVGIGGADHVESSAVRAPIEMKDANPANRGTGLKRAASAHGTTSGPSPATMPAGARKMIDALARHYPRSLPIEHVAKIAGVSTKSSQWPTNRREFEASPLVQAIGGLWRTSETGVWRYGLENQPDDPAALLEFWIRGFPPSVGNMLKVLVAERDWLSREEIAERAGVSITSSALAVLL
jgi:hypothetical protein